MQIYPYEVVIVFVYMKNGSSFEVKELNIEYARIKKG